MPNQLSPEIYPIILGSTSFKDEILNIQIADEFKLKDYLLNRDMSFFELYDYYRYVVWSSDNEFIPRLHFI